MYALLSPACSKHIHWHILAIILYNFKQRHRKENIHEWNIWDSCLFLWFDYLFAFTRTSSICIPVQIIVSHMNFKAYITKRLTKTLDWFVCLNIAHIRSALLSDVFLTKGVCSRNRLSRLLHFSTPNIYPSVFISLFFFIMHRVSIQCEMHVTHIWNTKAFWISESSYLVYSSQCLTYKGRCSNEKTMNIE